MDVRVWTIKKAECWRIKVFELWCWRRLLRVPWTARWSSQSILKEINPEYSLEGLMLKLKLQSFGHLMWRTDSLGKDPDAGKDWRQEEKGSTEDKMFGWHHWIMNTSLSKLWDLVMGREAWHAASMGSQRVGSDEWLNWTEQDLTPESLNNLLLCLSALSHCIPLYPSHFPKYLNVFPCQVL